MNFVTFGQQRMHKEPRIIPPLGLKYLTFMPIFAIAQHFKIIFVVNIRKTAAIGHNRSHTEMVQHRNGASCFF